MLAIEHSRRQHFAEPAYDSENSIHSQAPFPSLDMDAYDMIDPMLDFHPLPYSYFDNPSMFATEPMQTIKEEMYQLHELPPALISSGSAPSIASAASSTIGSPYSGPSHTILSQDGYEHGATYGLGGPPGILNHESFHHDILGAPPMDAELSMPRDNNHDKSSSDRSYVGECADLSSCSAPESSTIAQPKSRFGPMPPPDHASRASHPCLSLTASSEALFIPSRSDRGVSTDPLIVSTSALSSIGHSAANNDHTSRPTSSLFKSPTTPASASARSRRFSSVFPVHARPHTLFTEPIHMTPNNANATPPHLSASSFQSHFFAQSSGNFVSPLESSCSSLLTLSFLSPIFPAVFSISSSHL
jgi:hypothetical protein